MHQKMQRYLSISNNHLKNIIMPPGVTYDKKKPIERKKLVTDDDFVPIVSLEPGGKYPQRGYKIVMQKEKK